MTRFAAPTLLLFALAGPAVAQTSTWSSAVSGTWNTPARWSTGVPGSTTTATITAAGTYTVTLDINPSIRALTLNSTNATLAFAGHTLTASNASTLTAGTLDFQNATWAGAGTLTNTGATIRVTGTSVIASPFGTTGTISIEGDANITSNATLTVASGFTNGGAITLTSVGAGYNAALVVTGGTLTNAAAGTLTFAAGAGGVRTLQAATTNLGTVAVNAPLTLAGNFTNSGGTVTIAANQTVENGGSRTFTQAGGTLAINGDLAWTDSTFAYTGGTITGAPRLLMFTGGSLGFAAGPLNAASFIVEGTAGTLTSDVPASQTVTVRGDATYGSSAALAAVGRTNNGTIVLTSVGAGYGAALNAGAGTFTNAAGGTVRADVGAFGPRTLSGTFVNQGAVTANTSLTLDGDFTNTGTVTIAADQTVSNNGSRTFTQAGGTLAVNGEFAWTDGAFRYTGGTITGTPRLAMITGGSLGFAAGPLDAASFLVQGAAGTLTSDIPANQTLTLRGDATYGAAGALAVAGRTNNGTVVLTDVGAGYGAALNAGAGTFTNAAGGTVRAEPGVGGPRTLQGTVVNQGTVVANASILYYGGSTVSNAGSFTVAAGQTFSNVTANATFEQLGGTLTLTGELVWTDGTFRYTAGTIVGTPRLVMTGGGLLEYLPGTKAAGSVLVQGSYGTLASDVPANQTITLRGDAAYASPAILTAAGRANSGTVVLTSAGAGYGATLTAGAGTFTNAAGGVIRAEPGAGGPRTLQGTVSNQGAVTANAPLALDGTFTNTGTVTVPAGQSITNSGAVTFTQAGGTLAAAGDFAWADAAFAHSGGIITGTVRLPMVNGGTLAVTAGAGAGDYLVQGQNGTLTTDLPAGRTLTVRGDSAYALPGRLTVGPEFTNRATVTLTSAGAGYGAELNAGSATMTNASGGVIAALAGAGGPRTLTGSLTNAGRVSVAVGTILDETGNFSQTAGGFFRDGIAVGSTPGLFRVAGAVSIAGTLELDLTGPNPAASSVYTILHSDTLLSGTFGNANGRVSVPGGSFAIGYGFDNVGMPNQFRSTVYVTDFQPVPEPASILLTAAAGLGLWRLRRRGPVAGSGLTAG